MDATRSMFGGITIADDGTIAGIPKKKLLHIVYGEDSDKLTAMANALRAKHHDARVRDARVFTAEDVEACDSAIILGDWPVVEAAYKKAGIKVQKADSDELDAEKKAPAPTEEQAAQDELTREEIIARLEAHGFKVRNKNTKTETLKKRLDELDAEKA